MNKPSCINELKDLANRLSDRDLSLKERMKKVKVIINCEESSEKQKLQKIREICNGN